VSMFSSTAIGSEIESVRFCGHVESKSVNAEVVSEVGRFEVLGSTCSVAVFGRESQKRFDLQGTHSLLRSLLFRHVCQASTPFYSSKFCSPL
jgi:hypothetical protein